MTNSKRPAPVLVTGAGGLIGSVLSDRLADAGYAVLRLDLDLDMTGVDYACDLTDPRQIADVLAEIADEYGPKFDAVVHLAAYFDFTGEPHPLYQKLNVDGTRQLLDALSDYQVGRFIYASTMLVHAPTTPGIPIDEDSPLQAKWVYPESKLQAEGVIREVLGARSTTDDGGAMPLPFTILRLAGLYTDDCGSPTLSHQIQRIYEKKLTGHVYAGDAATGQSFVHLDDAVAALATAVEKAATLPDEHIALIGEPEVVSYQALNNAISQTLFGEALAVTEVPESAAKTGAILQLAADKAVPDALSQPGEPFIRPFMIELAEDHYELDLSYAEETLDFKPTHRLRDEISNIVERLRDDPVTFYERNDLQPPPWLERFSETDNPNTLREDLIAQEEDEHSQFLWAHFMTLALGAWLLATPVSTGMSDVLLAWLEMAVGAGIMIASLFALKREHTWARWLNVVFGLGIAFAPLVTWTPDPAAYLNDTLVGTLVACLALGARPILGAGIAARADPSVIPDGWNYSPSTWLQRLPIIVLAFIGLFLSRYLAAYQLGHTSSAWDPFFGAGTEQIITSEVSKAWPVADAGLGAYVYLLEILAGVVGSQRRWRTTPWLVLLFGFLIVPLGAVSIYFIIIQPIVIGTWCTLCLIAAAAMVLQIPYSFDEILASLQFLRQRALQGEPWLRVMFRGDAQAPPGDAAGIVPEPELLKDRSGNWLKEMLLGGLSMPWNLVISALLGVALMCSRLIAGTDGALADSDHLLGALVILFSVSAFAELARPLRFVNVLLGIALIGAPFLFSGGGTFSVVLDILIGTALMALAVPRGSVKNQYGVLDRYLV